MGSSYVIPERPLLIAWQLRPLECSHNEIELLGLGMIGLAPSSLGKARDELLRIQLCIDAIGKAV